MSTLKGTLTVCGPSQGYALTFTCSGSSCDGINGFPGTTCVEDGVGLTCTNNVICSGQTNYTSTFTLDQARDTVSQTQNITVNTWCENITLIADGSTGGTNATGVSTGNCGPPDTSDSTTTSTSTAGTTSTTVDSTSTSLSTTTSGSTSSLSTTTTETTSTRSSANVSTTTTASDTKATSTTALSKTTSSCTTTTQPPYASSYTPTSKYQIPTSPYVGTEFYSVSATSAYSTVSGSSPQTSYTQTNHEEGPSGWQSWTGETPSTTQGSGISYQPSPSSSLSSYSIDETAAQNPSGYATPSYDSYSVGSVPSYIQSNDNVYTSQDSSSSFTSINLGETSGSNELQSTTSTLPETVSATSSGGSTIGPQIPYTGSGSSYRKSQTLRLWTGILLIFTLFCQGTLAMPNMFESEFSLEPRSIEYCGTLSCRPVSMVSIVSNTTDVILLKTRKITPAWKEFADVLAEYLAGKIQNGGEFADNLIAELKNSVCEHISGQVTNAIVTKALAVDLTEACVASIYTGNAIIAPELEFLSVLGATIVCNLIVSTVTETVVPQIKDLGDTITDICEGKKPCSENLLTDPNNCGRCGNVCATGACANGACTANTCTGQTCATFGPCGPGGSCVCASTSEGTGFCVDGETPCLSLSGCTTSLDCASGEICAVGSCCTRNVCVGATFCGGDSSSSTSSSSTTTTTTTTTSSTTTTTTTTTVTTTTTTTQISSTTTTGDPTSTTSTTDNTSDITTTTQSSTTELPTPTTTASVTIVVPARSFHLQATAIASINPTDSQTFQRSDKKYAQNALDGTGSTAVEYLRFSETEANSGTVYIINGQGQLVDAVDGKVANAASNASNGSIRWDSPSDLVEGQAPVVCQVGSESKLSCNLGPMNQLQICSASTEDYGILSLRSTTGVQPEDCRDLEVVVV